MSEKTIELKGVRVNNLKNIDLEIALNRLIVITGVSGSGKSSLAFDTLYAEGQRRYVESLSAYARQFLGRLDKPEADSITGIPPAVAIDQRVNTTNPRSTVGTSTELYDYLKLLYAKIGKTISPLSGEVVTRHGVDDIVRYILDGNEGKTATVLVKLPAGEEARLSSLLRLGFSRVRYDNEYARIEDLIERQQEIDAGKDLFLVVDRVTVDEERDTVSRVTGSVETALSEGDGCCHVDIDGEMRAFSTRFEADGIVFEEPSVNMFSFNSPLGACPVCGGYGKVLGIDEDLVVPNKSLSVYDGAVACWHGEKMEEWKKRFTRSCARSGFPVHTPYYILTAKEKEVLWKERGGIDAFFKHLEEQKYKIQNRVMIARYTGKTRCPCCQGTRLKKEASRVRVGGKAITELVDLPISGLHDFFTTLSLPEHDAAIAGHVLPEIHHRVNFLLDVGLGYLTMNRLSSSLSGGESQRIRLATSLGSALVGSLYVLDEPSIGLHARDTRRLISVLERLKELENTVVVVEHDEEMITAAEEIIDVGPLAGHLGGEIVFQGSLQELKKARTLTADYIRGTRKIPVPSRRRTSPYFIELTGATENNLKNVTVKIPLEVMTVVTGVSGSGKSTLVKNILVPALHRHFDSYHERPGSFHSLGGHLERLKGVEFIDQNPIGKSSRSNPVTYIKAWDDIRKLFANEKLSRLRGFKPSFFSFNVPGGRCEECRGDGIVKVEMQFMADIYLKCEHCKGTRFKEEVMEVRYQGKNIFEVLEMTVEQAVEFFSRGKHSHCEKSIVNRLQKLLDVGVGYVKLGQPSNTLSGGESQRLKLAYYLSLERFDPTLFVFDEPTTGLHFHDIHKLMDALSTLIDKGHSVLVIEHNMDVIKCADHVIDLGPGGGKDGGNVLFEGTPEELVKCKQSCTGMYLERKLLHDEQL
jgi:excinuclease ABC subunit A